MDITHLYIHTVSYKTVSTRGLGGDPAFGTLTSVAGRWEHKYGVIRKVDGEEITYRYRFASDTLIPTQSRVWPPGADTNDPSASVVVLDVESAPTLDGGTTVNQHMLG